MDIIEESILPDHIIKVGDHVIIKRQNYAKLHKFGTNESTSMLGKDKIELENIRGHPYFSSFKMILKDKAKRLYSLEHCREIRDLKEEFTDREFGIDNRNIQDDGQSQMLSTEDITRLKDKDLSSSEIVTHLIENSKTFSSKTEYSQEKYLKKKEKKYFEYVQIRRPTVRLLAEIFYKQDSLKVLGLRCDSLTQLLCYANINSTGSYLLYESGTNGLLPAAILNAIGHDTSGNLIHMHPGNIPQKQSLVALNFPEEQRLRCISVNIYSVLRHYYQADVPELDENNSDVKKRKIDIDDDEMSTPSKIIKMEEDKECVPVKEKVEKDKKEMTCKRDQTQPSLQHWQVENSRACEVLKKGLDSLIIAAKEHPFNIVQALLPFINNSAPLVVFSPSREPLVTLYSDFKQRGNITGVRITNNWMRSYQVLPNRTHPAVNMEACGGYLLTGWVVQSKPTLE